ncbi:MerR family transcriptional regulator [Streptomyces benahoarensis]|uniref:MerR family transcriptional regulator n=1 Tax=Streptomyces benahoarensis TaxID=2595054 RepID=A0A553ZMP6_9ACTN|nr:MerR family transcriptional regulator [Streptomyces benahoarensis]TSB31747.1 MerR family transcriptional regulator [Streptomyces benahoarensis]TSB42712.1 MerR family transcriptional regulator [Streptomyces benahoarensis]
MDGTTRYSIGELSRRTGVPVRTIRFYSDEGLVPPADRTHAGHRRYAPAALQRLDLIRSLRELGIGLATIRRVLDHELPMARVALAQAEAVEVQIRALRLRRSVLRAAAARGTGPEETTLMHRLTQLTGAERRRLIDDFLDATFGAGHDPAAAAMVRTALPDLPEDPSADQVTAWTEIAGLLGDADFRARMGRSAARQASGEPLAFEALAGEEVTRDAHHALAEARDAELDPYGAQATALVDGLVRRFAEACGRAPDAGFRAWLTEQLTEAHDPRAERYWRLVWAVNGWSVLPHLVPVHSWFLRALCGGRDLRDGDGAGPVARDAAGKEK